MTRNSSTRKRTLVRWSNSSRKNTTLKPRQGEPSRRMGGSLLLEILEVAIVDRVERRFLDRQPPQRTAGLHHRRGSLRPHVALRQEPETARTNGLDRAHAGNRGEPVGKPDAVGLDLD